MLHAYNIGRPPKVIGAPLRSTKKKTKKKTVKGKKKKGGVRAHQGRHEIADFDVYTFQADRCEGGLHRELDV